MRSQRLTILLTPEEKEAMAAKAAQLQLSTSEMLRLAFDAFEEQEDRALLDNLADELEQAVGRARQSVREARAELATTLRELRRNRKRGAKGR